MFGMSDFRIILFGIIIKTHKTFATTNAKLHLSKVTLNKIRFMVCIITPYGMDHYG